MLKSGLSDCDELAQISLKNGSDISWQAAGCFCISPCRTEREEDQREERWEERKETHIHRAMETERGRETEKESQGCLACGLLLTFSVVGLGLRADWQGLEPVSPGARWDEVLGRGDSPWVRDAFPCCPESFPLLLPAQH